MGSIPVFGSYLIYSFYVLKLAINMAKAKENLIKIKCENCGRVNYWSHKNKRKVERKIDLKKFCNWCRKRTTHKETKK